jgi:hypothetical protein
MPSSLRLPFAFGIYARRTGGGTFPDISRKLFDLFLAPSSQELEHPSSPGRFNVMAKALCAATLSYRAQTARLSITRLCTCFPFGANQMLLRSLIIRLHVFNCSKLRSRCKRVKNEVSNALNSDRPRASGPGSDPLCIRMDGASSYLQSA